MSRANPKAKAVAELLRDDPDAFMEALAAAAWAYGLSGPEDEQIKRLLLQAPQTATESALHNTCLLELLLSRLHAQQEKSLALLVEHIHSPPPPPNN